MILRDPGYTRSVVSSLTKSVSTKIARFPRRARKYYTVKPCLGPRTLYPAHHAAGAYGGGRPGEAERGEEGDGLLLCTAFKRTVRDRCFIKGRRDQNASALPGTPSIGRIRSGLYLRPSLQYSILNLHIMGRNPTYLEEENWKADKSYRRDWRNEISFDTELFDELKPLRNAVVVDKPPYVSGTLPLSSDAFDLYYRKGSSLGHLNLAHASAEDLLALAQACQPATFGRGQENVLDETYRKAGKMDANQFSTPLVPERTSLADAIRDFAVEDPEEEDLPIKLELYKLNIYGEGSFFKSHVDTPRSESMFGSLVLIFPTKHEGGSLVFRHGGKEWTFDSAKAVSEQDSPSVGFVIFFSDVEHEVTPVTSGQRVTLTERERRQIQHALPLNDDIEKGNDDKSNTPSLSILHNPNEVAIRTAIESVLVDPTFFATGGTLGFGLHHVYPFYKSISHVHRCLKGSDATLYRVFSALGFEPTVYLLYRFGYNGACLLPEPLEAHFNKEADTEFRLDRYLRSNNGIIVDRVDGELDEEVMWVTKPREDLNRADISYLMYGNEVSAECGYGNMCLVVRVGHPGKRMEYPSAIDVEDWGKKKDSGYW
ncbi:hypothetical protein OF83DRAFT_1150151 [Amylostereum chailletii]|nr:hypothetical protein OF83DRAFT_1150151 [Amylostereum chailletii]